MLPSKKWFHLLQTHTLAGALLISLLSYPALIFSEWLGLLTGCVLVVANLAVWRWTVAAILPNNTNSATESARFALIKLMGIGQIKLLLIGVVVLLAKKFLHVDLVYVLVGLFLLPVALATTGVHSALRREQKDATAHSERRGEGGY